MITRREMVKAGAGLAAIIAAGKAPAALVRSMLGMRNAILGKPLPYDAEVEYLESTGTQYIDTGVILSQSLGAECVFAPLEYDAFALGINYNGVRFYTPTILDSSHIDYGYGDYVVQPKILSLRQKIKASVNYLGNQQAIIEDGSYNLSSLASRDYTARRIIAFGFYGYVDGVDEARLKKIRAYSIKMSDGSSIVRDFISVRFTNELGQSEGAVFDRVSGHLFRNQGTGAFVIGPDI